MLRVINMAVTGKPIEEVAERWVLSSERRGFTVWRHGRRIMGWQLLLIGRWLVAERPDSPADAEDPTRWVSMSGGWLLRRIRHHPDRNYRGWVQLTKWAAVRRHVEEIA